MLNFMGREFRIYRSLIFGFYTYIDDGNGTVQKTTALECKYLLLDKN